ncbi:RICIN domain-containing protein [Streptomyces sp. NPDC000594]|uniref:RICIN domain-containing protein n=1 Tax=Streptomyces sp. NPDC000594 TaxID=3154261 RepID=UPI0033228051
MGENSKASALIAAAVIMIGGTVLSAPTAAASNQAPVAPRETAQLAFGSYLLNANSGKCLSPAGGNVVDNTTTVIYDCDTHPSRMWYLVFKGSGLYQLLNLNSGKCLSPAGGGVLNNTETVIYICDNHPSRLWYFSGSHLVNHNSGKCLSPAGGNIANNTPTVIYNCDTHPSRAWYRTVSG